MTRQAEGGEGRGPCAFALRALGAAPLSPSAKETHTGPGRCRVCGGPGDAHGPAWKAERIVSDSFGPAESLGAPRSPAVCGACAFFAVGRTFQESVRARALPVKLWVNVAWRSYSHIFSAAGHLVPRRQDWRAFLLSPPEPPFLAVMTTAGTKNLLYRATVAEDREVFPLLVEEATVWVDRAALARVLSDFEAALADGLSRDALLSGRHSTSTILKVGRDAWLRHETALAPHRTARLALLRLAHAVASRPVAESSSTSITKEAA